MGKRTAVVTGANRGIGFEICKQLRDAGVDVLLTARDPGAGERAAEELGVRFSQLDVADPRSIDRLADEITNAGDFHILVNNAAIALDGFDADVARKTVDVNFYGTMRVTDELLARIGDQGRIVMVSSGAGTLDHVGEQLRARFNDQQLTRAQLSRLVEHFVDDVATGAHTERGWPSSAYSVSKVALNALTRIVARELAGDPRNIKVNAACPGWVRTRMGGPSAPRTPEQGARTAVWLALLPEDGPSGGFFRDERSIEW